MKHDLWAPALADLGRPLSRSQSSGLVRYRNWLRDEAIPAGALGPAESERLDDRHILDSLLFLHGWPEPTDPETLWDLGSGAGLPGIPLAILLPETEVRLIDRSRRRCDLMRRVTRILDLSNVLVEQADIDNLRGTAAMLVSRATLGPERLAPLMRRLLTWGGVGVLGGSWTNPPVAAGWSVREIPVVWLDRTVWLLIMRG